MHSRVFYYFRLNICLDPVVYIELYTILAVIFRNHSVPSHDMWDFTLTLHLCIYPNSLASNSYFLNFSNSTVYRSSVFVISTSISVRIFSCLSNMNMSGLKFQIYNFLVIFFMTHV